MALKINIGPEPSQVFEVVLAGQNCEISLYQRMGNLYLDLVCNGATVISGAICHNDTNIVQIHTDRFIGNLRFLDEEGLDEPRWETVGVRHFLYYLPPEEVEELR